MKVCGNSSVWHQRRIRYHLSSPHKAAWFAKSNLNIHESLCWLLFALSIIKFLWPTFLLHVCAQTWTQKLNYFRNDVSHQQSRFNFGFLTRDFCVLATHPQNSTIEPVISQKDANKPAVGQHNNIPCAMMTTDNFSAQPTPQYTPNRVRRKI